MRKVIVVPVLILLASVASLGQESTFYDKVFGFQNCRDCYFLSVEVESDRFVGKIVVESDDLLRFLEGTRNLSRDESIQFVKNILHARQRLPIKNVREVKNDSYLRGDGLSDHEFRIVRDSEEVEKVASKGCISFVKYYFLGKTLEPTEEKDEGDCKEFISRQSNNLFLGKHGFLDQNLIISKLFAWQIALRVDDISGFLTIDNRSVKREKKNVPKML